MIYEKIIAFLLLILYIFTFGRKSLLKYLEGGVSINIKEEVMKDVEPPGKSTYTDVALYNYFFSELCILVKFIGFILFSRIFRILSARIFNVFLRLML